MFAPPHVQVAWWAAMCSWAISLVAVGALVTAFFRMDQIGSLFPRADGRFRRGLQELRDAPAQRRHAVLEGKVQCNLPCLRARYPLDGTLRCAFVPD